MCWWAKGRYFAMGWLQALIFTQMHHVLGLSKPLPSGSTAYLPVHAALWSQNNPPRLRPWLTPFPLFHLVFRRSCPLLFRQGL